jgi:predicted TIM-barrel fold metal-dependent hydrolase
MLDMILLHAGFLRDKDKEKIMGENATDLLAQIGPTTY